MTGIRFIDLRVTDNVRIDLTCVTPEAEHALWFEFSHPVALTNDAIATALSTLTGRLYAEVKFDFPVSERALAGARKTTGATVTSSGTCQSVAAPRVGHQLSFSGGFDSLAALCLMPEHTRLVSMDFGGRFSRERSFFETFPTTRVSTNVTATGLHRNSWAFMGIGAILLGDHNRAQYHTFGSILEAGADNLRVTPEAGKNETFPPFRAAGYENAPYVAGLTEIGTLLVLAAHRREHVGASLASLAGPGEEKLYRKQVLAQIVADRLGIDVPLTLTPKPPRPHFKYGQNFALDFLSIYVAKFGGETVARELVDEIPDEALALSKKLDLTFFERANTTLYHHFPAPLMGGLVDRLSSTGIRFYTEDDWNDYRHVREFLTAYHPIAAR